jgi:ABC-type nickel/cobalt efflux system permease component RcnA
MLDLVPLLAAGAVLGVLHSFEPDHLAAMATLVGQRSRSRVSAFANGALWGLGHTVTLGSLGAVLVVAGMHPAGELERVLEVGVALMLMALGITRLRSARRRLHGHRHSHGDIEHEHYHLHAGHSSNHGVAEHLNHNHVPICIGMLHGLAGTGAVLILAPAFVVTGVRNYLLYVFAFGLGSILSMATYCGGLASLAAWLQLRFSSAAYRFATATGVLSIGVGVAWLWRAVA